MALIPSLKDQLHQLLAAADTDADLAESIVDSPAWQQIVELGLKTNTEAAAMLGYSSKRSVDSMTQKNENFPQPVITGNRWSARQLAQYQHDHSRKRRS